jgi:hypothetical protein
MPGGVNQLREGSSGGETAGGGSARCQRDGAAFFAGAAGRQAALLGSCACRGDGRADAAPAASEEDGRWQSVGGGPTASWQGQAFVAGSWQGPRFLSFFFRILLTCIYVYNKFPYFAALSHIQSICDANSVASRVLYHGASGKRPR